jgi:hypothetical protein
MTCYYLLSVQIRLSNLIVQALNSHLVTKTTINVKTTSTRRAVIIISSRIHPTRIFRKLANIVTHSTKALRLWYLAQLRMFRLVSIATSLDICSVTVTNYAPTRWRKLVVGMGMGISVVIHVVDMVEGALAEEAKMVE